MDADDNASRFTRLFHEHHARLRAFALSLALNDADADDLFQFANVAMWKIFDEFEAGSNFMAWAGRVVFLTAKHQQRLRGREKLQFGDAYIDAIARVTIGGEAVDEVDERELAVLRSCVARLSVKHQAMLRVRYSEGASAERMGEVFDRSAVAVRLVLSRIRKTLYGCVTEHLYGHHAR